MMPLKQKYTFPKSIYKQRATLINLNRSLVFLYNITSGNRYIRLLSIWTTENNVYIYLAFRTSKIGLKINI